MLSTESNSVESRDHSTWERRYPACIVQGIRARDVIFKGILNDYFNKGKLLKSGPDQAGFPVFLEVNHSYPTWSMVWFGSFRQKNRGATLLEIGIRSIFPSKRTCGKLWVYSCLELDVQKGDR